jgi:hypothetical protein
MYSPLLYQTTPIPLKKLPLLSSWFVQFWMASAIGLWFDSCLSWTVLLGLTRYFVSVALGQEQRLLFPLQTVPVA